MKTYTLEKKTTFINKDTKVKVQIIDGTYFAKGEGRAHCADGDDFDEETGEEIAEIRARLKAFNKFIELYKDDIQKKEKWYKIITTRGKNFTTKIKWFNWLRRTESLDR